jgi:hypothetical protein
MFYKELPTSCIVENNMEYYTTKMIYRVIKIDLG